jgi:hypothetical protein
MATPIAKSFEELTRRLQPHQFYAFGKRSKHTHRQRLLAKAKRIEAYMNARQSARDTTSLTVHRLLLEARGYLLEAAKLQEWSASGRHEEERAERMLEKAEMWLKTAGRKLPAGIASKHAYRLRKSLEQG